MADEPQQRPPRWHRRRNREGRPATSEGQAAQIRPEEQQTATHNSQTPHPTPGKSAQPGILSTRRRRPKPKKDAQLPTTPKQEMPALKAKEGSPAAMLGYQMQNSTMETTLRAGGTWVSEEEGNASTAPTTRTTQASLAMASGQVCGYDVILVPWRLVTNYPTLYVQEEDRDQLKAYFTTNLHKEREWDFYFTLQPGSAGKDSILFVPLSQFESFLDVVATELGPISTISALRKDRLWDNAAAPPDWPRPRFLARVKNAQGLKPATQRIQQYPLDNYDEWSMEAYKAFKAKMEVLLNAGKKDSRGHNFGTMRMERLEKQRGYGRVTKRVQRYLGLRDSSAHAHNPDSLSTAWHPDMVAPFQPKHNVRFVCLDVEAFEFNTNLVTEFGFAVLDTEDIIGVAPGENGKNWIAAMKGYHFRITEYTHLKNKRFVKGCPERFNFGPSSFVSLRDMASVTSRVLGDSNAPETCPVVLVGHDILGDLKYLLKVNFNIWNVPHVIDEVDTQVMFRRVQRSNNGRSLVAACDSVDIETKDLHNAGNDAHYTLAAMVAMAVKQSATAPQDSKPWQMVEEAEWTDGELDDGGMGQRSSQPAEKENVAADISGQKPHKPQKKYSPW
ncbi:hypothetical protein Micbo1qcDRAFT_200276 [Microdochium bolleyi]|uniref:Gfd2/YDR514C-like C-terminal domain-containing protein n=1 Tax=Microdochium bolleyi TaxID=196109 RepID=A0A136JKE2_9PEZI|nr:hypothetical protein Micbo1qcDRAFT_200276 [Microdochium bolleyi]